MEIIIKETEKITRHKYFEDEKEAEQFYKQAIKDYGKENVEITTKLTKFYN